MINLGLFQRYNDAYGHSAGDDCLRMIGRPGRHDQPARQCRRPAGGESAVLLPGTGSDGAPSVAESVRSAVAERRMVRRANTAQVGTISVGVAALYPDGHQVAREFTEAADAALYAAKNAGRNCVRIAEGASIAAARCATVALLP